MKQKLFVLSMDAMVHEDVAYMMTKPNFKKIMEKRAEVEEVISVYPTSTYPAHTTLMTGCYPGKHGIFSNFPLKVFNGDTISHWPLYQKSVYVEDIFAAAKRAGCTTASVYWPITGRNENIDYIINEYFFYYPDEINHVEEIFASQGANEAALKAIRENMHLFPKKEGQTPLADRFDGFLMGCTCSLIRNEQPDVLLVHNCIMDTFRHKNGVFFDSLPQYLDRADEWLGDVISAMEDAGVYEDTNFVILSDHGQREYTRVVHINKLLAEGGFIDVAPNGTIYDWQAYSQTNGKSTTIHLRDKDNKILYKRVYDYLLELQKNPEYGIEKVYTMDELAEKYGLGGPFAFMMETDEETYFGNNFTGELIVNNTPGTRRACHGYAPEKGAKPIFLAHGPSFKDGAVLKSTKMVDIAPTLAATFGQTMPQADGRCLTELLRGE